jgi:hypothetical protein
VTVARRWYIRPVVVVADRARILAPVDERAARRSLRDQVARLEHELALSGAPAGVVARHAGPRILGLGELEETRDALAARLALVRGEAAAVAERHAEARLLLERLLVAPHEHRWVRVSNEDLGEPGCKHYHALPRFGILGMMLGWWHVKISSGCPLATAPPDGAALPQARRRAARRPGAGCRRERPGVRPAPGSVASVPARRALRARGPGPVRRGLPELRRAGRADHAAGRHGARLARRPGHRRP